MEFNYKFHLDLKLIYLCDNELNKYARKLFCDKCFIFQHAHNKYNKDTYIELEILNPKINIF